MFTIKPTLLALAGAYFLAPTLAHPAALTTTSPDDALLLDPRGTTHSVTYCDRLTPQHCTTIPNVKNDLTCHTFAAPGFTILDFSPGLSCEVYSSLYCTKGRGGFATKGGVEGVEGYFDAERDGRAVRNEVGVVGSFKCA
ncbi:hypothetical protein LTR85_011454 [Meristemomyces frigidus]|nr:hypothetical protein LTR85_011454 [Meristemomyces frigidus]